jgi:transcriptional regulator with XRE-family HTH domain
MNNEIFAAQLRAARALKGWSRDDLAAAAKTTVRTLARLEAGEGTARLTTLEAIRAAFEAAGVEFISEREGGAGVRFLAPGTATHMAPSKCVQAIHFEGDQITLAFTDGLKMSISIPKN